MEAIDLRMEVTTEVTMEDTALYRAEVRDPYGNLVASTAPTVNPARATRAGGELLAEARSDVAYSQARNEAHRLFTAA